jgi:3-hydroxyisobutyrate dehydrogenase
MSLRIGYLGLGSLGAPIARCIARGDFALSVYDVLPAAMAGFDLPGVTRAPDPLAVARESDILIVCVRTDADLDGLASPDLFAALGENGILMIHSTVAPELAVTVADRARPYGVAVLDCGVSRGGGGEEVNGDLSIFLGGDPAVIEQARPLLDHLGTWKHLGPVGRGMQGKLLNNLVSIANYGMAAHILELGEHMGFERESLKEMLMAGSAQGFALKVAPGFVRPDRAPNMLALLGKDIDHARSLAEPGNASLKALLAAADSMVSLLREKIR